MGVDGRRLRATAEDEPGPVELPERVLRAPGERQGRRERPSGRRRTGPEPTVVGGVGRGGQTGEGGVEVESAEGDESARMADGDSVG